GPDPRTGHAESSTWIAGLEDSSKVAMWLSSMNMLELFRLHPNVRYATAPLAVTNVPAIALAKAVGLTWVNEMRGFREYSGVPIDHTL
ncbi:GNAT family N-acetyltransferase, partial [Mycobacterium kansasii]